MLDIVYDVQADLDALNLINGKKGGGGAALLLLAWILKSHFSIKK